LLTEDLSAILSSPLNRGLATDVALRLRTAILRGHFAPSERLREEVLAKAMGVSRGPVREALSQLQREGLVIIQRNRGAFVAQLTHQDAEEVYSLRLVLERMAARRVVQYATEAHFAELQAIVDVMASYATRAITEHEAAELDVRFHEVLFQGSNHRRLYECWTNVRLQIHILLLNRNVADSDFRDHLVKGHQTILDALRDRDETRALIILDGHLRGSYERVLAHMRPANDDQTPEARMQP